MMGDREKCIQVQMDEYLSKPFSPRELRARADSMLRRPRERSDVGLGDAAVAPAAPAAPESWATRAANQLRDPSGE